jgi:molybdopterin-containing oxidoreductase family iron-sulfur binding subunit
VFHPNRARCIVALDADPFSHGPAHVRHARDWAATRARIGSGEGERASEPHRTFAIEASPTLFGARADERVPMAPAQIEALLDEFSSLFAATNAGRAGTTSPLALRLAAALRDAGAASLIVAGPSLSARTHAQVAGLNQRLDAVGYTLDAIEPLDRVEGLETGSLADLTDAIEHGSIDTLLVVGGNPAYDAPGAVAFADALDRVPFSAHLSLYRDETSRRATWHLPASHDFESWGDARAHDGTATLLQPAILPLYDTRSAIEWLALLAGSDIRDGHALVETTWRNRMASEAVAEDKAGTAQADDGERRFAEWWRATLRAGIVDGSAAVPLTLPAAASLDAHGETISAAAKRPPHAERGSSLIAVFSADASVADGTFANNGWLQELPRPFTKLTWDNAIHLGAATATALGLATGDVARATAGGRSIDGPVWVLAGHAEGVATLPLGYGRRAAGRVGDGVGFDAFVIRGIDDAPVAIELAGTGRTHRFAVTQHRIDQDGRELARSVVAGAALPRADARPSLYPPIAYPEHAWAMAIDLDACIGCNACTIACQAENNIPVVGAEEVRRGREMHWIRVDRYADNDRGHGSVFQPVPCMHCEDAPCEVVCPVGATVHDSEGLNVQVYNRCVGTRFCSNNCPYKVRRFNFLQYADETTETLKAMRNPDVTVRQRGVMEKCTYCVQRLSRARLAAEKSGSPIADGDVVTACQSACPTQAIHFGDLNDPRSDVVRARASPRHYAMLDELNTRPRTTYLARVVAAAEPAKDNG